VSGRGDTPTGVTKVYGVAGNPVAHSLSPALHNAAFRALHLDAVSVAFRADATSAATVVDLIRRMGVRGLSITMPLKAAVVARCDARSETVDRLGAANCLVRAEDGAVRAESTDGDGLVRAIQCVTGRDVLGLACAVLGAGGAARAAIDALARAGAASVIVVARRTDAAASASRIADVARPGTTRDARDATLVVQATPIGMEDTDAEDDAPLLDASELGAGRIAVDLVYHPRVTPWLARAASAGATPVGGVEVLVHQAAAALELWLGQPIPLDALHDVVDAR
jgi:shikimate dehydrogenase